MDKKIRSTLYSIIGSKLVNIFASIHLMDSTIDKKNLIELYLLTKNERVPVEIRCAPDGESLIVQRKIPHAPILMGEYGEIVIASLQIKDVTPHLSRLTGIQIIENNKKIVALDFLGNGFIFSISNIGDDLILLSKASTLDGEKTMLHYPYE